MTEFSTQLKALIVYELALSNDVVITDKTYKGWSGFYSLLGQALQDFDLQKGEKND